MHGPTLTLRTACTHMRLPITGPPGRDQSVQKVAEALVENEDVLEAQLESLTEQLQLTRTATVDRRGLVAGARPVGLSGHRLAL